ncbi:ribosome maturation factor RimM [Oscillospiraceae bacterium PP1C4]
MKKQFIECGKIVTTQGIKGEVRVQPWCDTPDFLLDFETFFLEKDKTPIEIEYARVQKNIVVLKIKGIDTVEAAVSLRNKTIYVNRDDVEMDEGECFVQDLIDCTVVDIDTGADYGKIYDVRPTGSNDVYYLRDKAGVERLVPVIPSVVLERSLDEGIIKIRPLEGLFDD